MAKFWSFCCLWLGSEPKFVRGNAQSFFQYFYITENNAQTLTFLLFSLTFLLSFFLFLHIFHLSSSVCSNNKWPMLKAPPLVPRTYISRASNIDPTEGHYYFSSFWTNLGSILVRLNVEHIICPQCCKSQILEDLNEIYITGLTLTL